MRIGVDVGGTFTDFVLVDEERDLIYTGKQLTTPEDPSRAIIDGVARLIDDAGIAPAQVSGVVHGTTLVTNTIIERSGAKVGLISTQGHRDSLEMGREIRYDLYDLFLQPAPTLVPRRLRREVAERIGPDGDVLLQFDASAFRAVARDLVEREQVDAIAVCFMHAYRNPEHERAAGEILGAEFPALPFTLSSEVAPEIREFERASTACANAYVQPRMQRYLSTLEQKLEVLGMRSSLFVMLSGGGISTLRYAARFPIQLIESGPAGGAMAASHYGGRCATPDLISFDMGGTTAKMCLIENGRPARSREFEAGRVRRFRKGSGIPLRVSVVDMIEIGAGGGSIASIDSMGLLKVGPRSAGSEPGPAAYGRGGSEPTVTDADLLLGYLDPGYFLGGDLQLSPASAQTAMREQIGDPLEMTWEQSAIGVHDVVNENMAAATRRYLAEKGKDPRRYAMIAFGGAGPVHAYGLAKRLKINRIIVPFGAGVTSALGFLVAPYAVDDVRSYVARLDGIDWSTVNGLYEQMEAAARRQLLEAGANEADIVFERRADMRHVGQGFEIEVSLPHGTLCADSTARLREAFFDTYEELFERRVTEVAVEAMSWRLSASAGAPQISLRFGGDSSSAGEAQKGSREVYFEQTGIASCPVYDRYALRVGTRFSGPAVIEERESTTVVGPDATIAVDHHLNLLIDIQ